jgi:hypothetical protein
MLEGLSRFLVQHERCGAGFDVAHPTGLGSGRVSITCRGCGARHEYATATIEFERELSIEPAGAGGREPAVPIEPTGIPPTAPRQPVQIPPGPARYGERTSRTRAGARPRAGAPLEPPAAEGAIRRLWRSPGATAALTALVVVALTVAVISIVTKGGGTENHKFPTTSAPALAPPPTPVPGGRAGNGPAQTKTIRTERFTIEAPLGWTERTSTGGILLYPRGGGRVEVQVYFQRSPSLGLARMAHQTAAFLRRQVPGARVFPTPGSAAGGPAYELTARGPGETAIAVDIARGPYRYLLVRRIFAGAKPRSSEAAAAVERSFRPR